MSGAGSREGACVDERGKNRLLPVSHEQGARSHSTLHDAANQLFTRDMNPFNETRAERSNSEHALFAQGTYKLLAITIGTIGVFGFCNNVVVIDRGRATVKRFNYPAGQCDSLTWLNQDRM